MKTISTMLTTVALSIGLLTTTATSANAALIDQGATVYDNDLGISWLKNANLAATNTFGVSGIDVPGSMNWNTTQSWIGAMNTANYLGYSDWRLPTTTDTGTLGCNFSYNGTDCGYNSTGSEMAHLFYNELGNKSYYYTSGTGPQAGWGLLNTGPFSNLLSNVYWSGTEYASSTTSAWNFNFYEGTQIGSLNASSLYALAVRPGQVVAASGTGDPAPGATVPEPSTTWLVGIGLLGLVGAARRRLALRGFE